MIKENHTNSTRKQYLKMEASNRKYSESNVVTLTFMLPVGAFSFA